MHYVNKLKADLKSEKNKVCKLSKELNKEQKSKSIYEKIFQDCVEKTKREILNRKAKSNLTQTFGNK